MTDESVNAGVPQKRGLLGWVTRNSKAITALSAAAIPVVLAGMGWLTTKAINDQNLDKEYVNLAIGILAEDIGTEKCTATGKSGAVPEFAALNSAQNAVVDSTDSPTEAEEQALAKAQKTFDQSLSDAQIEELVGASGSRALRSYALGLLSEATPFGVELDKQQYVALLCGDVTVVELIESGDRPGAVPASESSGTGEGAASKELSEADAQLFVARFETGTLTELSNECLIIVEQSIGQITESAEVANASLPAGTYQAVQQLSWGTIVDGSVPTTSTETSARPRAEFAQLANLYWVRIRAGVADLSDQDC
jgi:hypothetical protein